jgi:hypothetical protein
MGATSSGLLDEELVAGADSTNEVADSTLTVSGEKNAEITAAVGYHAAGTPRVNWAGPCFYTLP